MQWHRRQWKITPNVLICGLIIGFRSNLYVLCMKSKFQERQYFVLSTTELKHNDCGLFLLPAISKYLFYFQSLNFLIVGRYIRYINVYFRKKM